VLAAQTKLAQDLNQRPELYEVYLTELLSLFLDKGVAIQNLRIANPRLKVIFHRILSLHNTNLLKDRRYG
jgi:phosphatidylinositol 4-kinase